MDALPLTGAHTTWSVRQDDGLFLQVEGASIDEQDHAADPCGQIGETEVRRAGRGSQPWTAVGAWNRRGECIEVDVFTARAPRSPPELIGAVMVFR